MFLTATEFRQVGASAFAAAFKSIRAATAFHCNV